MDGGQLVDIRGRVTEVQGMIIKAAVPGVKIGELCQLVSPDQVATGRNAYAEVVGFQGYETVLSPLGDIVGISSTTEVIPTGKVHHVGGWSSFIRSCARWYGRSSGSNRI